MMKKDDYRTEFEENRQEIDLNEENNGKIQSRTELHSKARKEKKRSGPKLINILLVLFTLIQVGILLYVIFNWDSPKSEPVNKVEDSEFQFEKSEKPESKEKIVDEELDKKEIEEAEAKKETEEEQAEKEAERVQKEQEAQKAEEEQAQKAAEEQARIEREAQAKKEQEAQANKEQQEQAKKEAEIPAARSHTVAAGETLYRISVNYYKSGDGVSKIMAANGLSSNEISVGQTLVIP